MLTESAHLITIGEWKSISIQGRRGTKRAVAVAKGAGINSYTQVTPTSTPIQCILIQKCLQTYTCDITCVHIFLVPVSFRSSVYTPGGALIGDGLKITQCMSRCISLPDCLAVDFNHHGQCWGHDATTACNPNLPLSIEQVGNSRSRNSLGIQIRYIDCGKTVAGTKSHVNPMSPILNM